jgi:hypothetical protein
MQHEVRFVVRDPLWSEIQAAAAAQSMSIAAFIRLSVSSFMRGVVLVEPPPASPEPLLVSPEPEPEPSLAPLLVSPKPEPEPEPPKNSDVPSDLTEEQLRAIEEWDA